MSERPSPAPGFAARCEKLADLSADVLNAIGALATADGDEADDRAADLIQALNEHVVDLAITADDEVESSVDREALVRGVTLDVQDALEPLSEYADAARAFAAISFWLGVSLVRWGDVQRGFALADAGMAADPEAWRRRLSDIALQGKHAHLEQGLFSILDRPEVDRRTAVRGLIHDGGERLTDGYAYTAEMLFGLASRLDPAEAEAHHGLARAAFEALANDRDNQTRTALQPLQAAYEALDTQVGMPRSEAFLPVDMDEWGGPITRDYLRLRVGFYIARSLLMISAPVDARQWLRAIRELDGADETPLVAVDEDRRLLLQEINEAIAVAAESGTLAMLGIEQLGATVGGIDQNVLDGLRSNHRASEDILALLLNLARWRSEDHDTTHRIEELLLKIMEQQVRVSAVDVGAARRALSERFGPAWPEVKGATQEYFETGEALFRGLEKTPGLAPFPFVIPYAAGLESLVRYALGVPVLVDGSRPDLGFMQRLLEEFRGMNQQFPQLTESKGRVWHRLRAANVDLTFWLNELPAVLGEVSEIAILLPTERAQPGQMCDGCGH